MDSTKITKSPVMLKGENKRFALDKDRDTRGYIKLETDGDKGLVVVTVDNVKFFPNGEYAYKLIFSGVKNEKRHYHMVGDISLSARGSGEGSFRINLKDLNGQGMAFSEFSSAIVAAMSMTNFREALHPVMKGDFSVSDDDVSPQTTTPTPRDYSPFYNKFVLENCAALDKKCDSFTDIVPFGHDLTGAQWKKVSDLDLFPVLSPGSAEPVKKYGHFLYGTHGSYCFIGVPGRFFPEEQPDGGDSGFVFWQPILGMENEAQDKTLPIEERRKNIYGYWIAAINRYNGHIEEIPLIEQ